MKAGIFLIFLLLPFVVKANNNSDDLDTILDKAKQTQNSAPILNNQNSIMTLSKSKSKHKEKTPPIIATIPVVANLNNNNTSPSTNNSTKSLSNVDTNLPVAPKGLEYTTVMVSRNLQVPLKSGNKVTVRASIPVYYRVRSILWDKDQVTEALSLKQQMDDYARKLADLKKESEAIRYHYNQLVVEGMPMSVLEPNSLSLPEDQRASAGSGDNTKESRWRMEDLPTQPFTIRCPAPNQDTSITVDSYLLTPNDPNLVYFIEPGYDPNTSTLHNINAILQLQEFATVTTISNIKNISEQLEKLKPYAR